MPVMTPTVPYLKVVHSDPSAKRTPDKSAAMLSVAHSSRTETVASFSDQVRVDEIDRLLRLARQALEERDFLSAGANLAMAGHVTLPFHSKATQAAQATRIQELWTLAVRLQGLSKR